MKLGEVRITLEGLKKIVNKELPIRTAYRLTKIMKAINDEFTSLEEARGKLIKKFAKEPEDGSKGPQGEIKVDPEKQDEFYKEFVVLLEEEIDLDINLISIEDLGDISLSPADMFGLQIILEEEIEAPKKAQEPKKVKKEVEEKKEEEIEVEVT